VRPTLQASNKVQVGNEVRVDPRLIQSSQILQLSRQDLEVALENELSDNPALERLEEAEEPLTEDAVLRTVAPVELKPSSEDFEYRRCLPNDDQDRVDWIDLVPTTSTLWDHLRAQLLPMLSAELEELGDYVVACVDSKGYLSMHVEEIALETGHEIDVVERVVSNLRRCEPSGVGACTLQECLLLQLRETDSLEDKLARIIVRHHIDDLVAKRTDRIMRKYRVLPDVVQAAFDKIHACSPYPGEAFSDVPSSMQPSRRSAISPDLILSLVDGSWEVEVRGTDPTSLRVSPVYRTRNRQLEEMALPPKDEKRHISEYLNRAENFIKSVRQRRQTLRAIGRYLVENQSGFVTTGRFQFLRALTRCQMAKDLGLHESTISRATMNKHVQLSTGEVVPFDVFFKPALRIQMMIEEILLTENPQRPLSDEAIARLLAERGVSVARRTVNKYRDRRKLVSSHKRKTA